MLVLETTHFDRAAEVVGVFDVQLAKQACGAVIPSRGNRAQAVPYNKERSNVECAFNLLKRARRLATRYEKTLRNYVSVVALGCAMLWLRI